MMKRLYFSILVLITCLTTAVAQDNVTFELSDGISNQSLKSKIERQLSTLLTAINKAETANGDINFSDISIGDIASISITGLWETTRFRCLDEEIVEHAITLKNKAGKVKGYQVRNIPLEMKPKDEAYTDNTYQEVCIEFDTNGQIVDFNVTIDKNQYMQIMKEGIKVDDLEKREQILNWCEKLRTAYIQRNMEFMQETFSDDALIITGHVRLRTKSEVQFNNSADIVYTEQNKQQYLRNLKKIFDNPKTGVINVQFKDFKIKRHGSKPNYYGVTLIQDWATDRYQDHGIVFLVWDFSDEDKPKIQVRTWQPEETPQDEVFTLNKFKLR